MSSLESKMELRRFLELVRVLQGWCPQSTAHSAVKKHIAFNTCSEAEKDIKLLKEDLLKSLTLPPYDPSLPLFYILMQAITMDLGVC